MDKKRLFTPKGRKKPSSKLFVPIIMGSEFLLFSSLFVFFCFCDILDIVFRAQNSRTLSTDYQDSWRFFVHIKAFFIHKAIFVRVNTSYVLRMLRASCIVRMQNINT
jgi:hypothetical protein